MASLVLGLLEGQPIGRAILLAQQPYVNAVIFLTATKVLGHIGLSIPAPFPRWQLSTFK
jgi:hypothetical protein